MMSPPALMQLEHAAGQDTVAKWPNYVEDIYAAFCCTAVHVKLTFQGRPVICPFMQPGNKHPFQGKHFSFWHCMSEGPNEDNRTPDLQRSERIRWIGWVIQNADNPALVRWWENQRSGLRGPKTHVPLWLFEHRYVVILNKDGGRYYLRTAYVLTPGREESLAAEWEATTRTTP